MKANENLLNSIKECQDEARADMRRIKALLVKAEDATRMMLADGCRTVKERVNAWTAHRERVKPLQDELMAAEREWRRLRDACTKVKRGTYVEGTVTFMNAEVS